MSEKPSYSKALPNDLAAGVVVFLVALPLCLGVALASNAPLISGIVAGVVGGVLVAWLSGSHTSISGPAAGLTAIVAVQIGKLGSFEAFLVAVILAGAMQLALGVLRAGSIAAFAPSSVIKGLLSAIGIILILKQIPHLLGRDTDWLGDMSFVQIDGENTFSALNRVLPSLHGGAPIIGLVSLALLIFWDRLPLARTGIPSALAVVILGVLMALGFDQLGGAWAVSSVHLVQVPVGGSLGSFAASLHVPDFSAITDPQILVAALTVAAVASLETLLNLEAVDKIDRKKRISPPNRELVAQGVGNIACGLLGGLPITSVVVRSSVGVGSGAETRVACFVHGVLLLVLVVFLPGLLNMIPLSCLAAVLMVTGFKLTTPAIFREMWSEGRAQFIPFVGTVVAIVLTDLLVGILIGLAIANLFILHGNLKRPLRRFTERRPSGEVVRVELANQVSFLSRAVLVEALRGVPAGGQVVLDARDTVYMDPDIVGYVREFAREIAPAHGIGVSLLGFEDEYEIEDQITYEDVSTREVQERSTPAEVLELMLAGNRRFVAGEPIRRDHLREVGATAAGQYPLAVVLACMDSRVATEAVFDLGFGDIFSIRVAGNIVSSEQLGSMEYGCGVAGSKLIVVLGHTRCGAVSATIDLVAQGSGDDQGAELENLPSITGPIAESVRAETATTANRTSVNEPFVRRVAGLNVHRTMRDIRERSATLRRLLDEGRIDLVGGIYDVSTGRVEIFDSE